MSYGNTKYHGFITSPEANAATGFIKVGGALNRRSEILFYMAGCTSSYHFKSLWQCPGGVITHLCLEYLPYF